MIALVMHSAAPRTINSAFRLVLLIQIPQQTMLFHILMMDTCNCMKKRNQAWKSIMNLKWMSMHVTIYHTHAVCPYTPSNSWLQRKYTVTPEVPQCINYLMKVNPKQWVSLITERVSPWSRNLFNLLHRKKNTRHSWKVSWTVTVYTIYIYIQI